MQLDSITHVEIFIGSSASPSVVLVGHELSPVEMHLSMAREQKACQADFQGVDLHPSSAKSCNRGMR
jgi:hypothetical protein